VFDWYTRNRMHNPKVKIITRALQITELSGQVQAQVVL
jgi:hypothetical protein